MTARLASHHVLIKHCSLTVTRLVDSTNPLNQLAGPLDGRAEGDGGVAAPLGEHDIVPSIFQRHFEPTRAVEVVGRQLEADDGVLVRPVALVAEDALDLHGGGVFGERLDARLEGGRRAVGAPGDVGAVAVEAARRGEGGTAQGQQSPQRRAPFCLHRAIATALGDSLLVRGAPMFSRERSARDWPRLNHSPPTPK